MVPAFCVLIIWYDFPSDLDNFGKFNKFNQNEILNISGNIQCHKIFSRSTTTFMSSLDRYVLWDTLYFIICYIYIIGVATLNGTTYIYNGLDYKWGHFTSYIWPDNDNLQSQIFRVKN